MAQIFNTKLYIVASHYIRQLNAKVTQTSLQRDIEENAYYPSLLRLNDTFNKYNIANSAFNVPVESFDDLEAPFVALPSPPTGSCITPQGMFSFCYLKIIWFYLFYIIILLSPSELLLHLFLNFITNSLH